MAWLTLPKFICWKLWLERNNRIFRGTSISPIKVVVKIKALLGDFIRSRPPLSLHSPFSWEEEIWFQSLNPGNFVDLPQRSPILQKWEIRKDKAAFELWRQEIGRNLLFFDGASKGNPGEAGGGGVLFGPDGNLKFIYSWNLGNESNNMAKALALWQGLNQALSQNIQDLSIVGDSRLIIYFLNSQMFPTSAKLHQVLQRISLFIPLFRSIDFFDVLRSNNEQADKAANEALPLGKGVIKINDVLRWAPIP